jgi:hypothetical protein
MAGRFSPKKHPNNHQDKDFFHELIHQWGIEKNRKRSIK